MCPAHFDPGGLYREARGYGAQHRARYLKQLQGLIARLRRGATAVRRRGFAADFSSVSAYRRSTARLRKLYRAMLGWPLIVDRARRGRPKATLKKVAEDASGTIYRAWIGSLPKLETYGLLFLPPRLERVPLVICQHGGLGTPEVISGFFGSENYNNLLRRILARGAACFAPQLLLWREAFGPKFDRQKIDSQLKQLGSSLTALEVHCIERCLDYLVTRPEIDGERIGMAGLSYGGFYAQYAAAADTRIKAAASSCFFNDRHVYHWLDWTWFDASHRFLDAEVAALVCPRALYVEVGKRDKHFAVGPARREAKWVAQVYRRLGIPERFCYREFSGKHEFSKEDDGIDFLMRYLT